MRVAAILQMLWDSLGQPMHRRDPQVPSRAVRVGDWKYIRNLRHELRFENAVMLTSSTWRAMLEAAQTEEALRLAKRSAMPGLTMSRRSMTPSTRAP